MFTDSIPVANPPGPRTQHPQLCAIDGDYGPGNFEKENRQSGKCT